MVREKEYDELSLVGLGSELPCYGKQTAYFDASNCPQVCGSEHLGGNPAAVVRAQPRGPQGPALQSEHR